METACPRNEDRGERRALHVLHHQVRHTVGRAIVVVMDLDHARMGQQARVPALLAEPVPELRAAGVLGAQQLNRDDPVEQGVAGPPHLAHTAGRDPALQPVTPTQQWRHARRVSPCCP